MKRLLLCVALCSLVAGSAAADDALPRKTLSECVAIALAEHPSLKAATASVQAGHERVHEAASNYLPQVTALYSAARRNTSAGARTGTAVNTPQVTFNFYDTGVSFTQVLFDFGQTLHNIRAAQGSEQALDADRSTQQATVVLNVKQAYFNVLAARRLLVVADETVGQNQKHLEQAAGRFRVGMAAKFDVTQVQVQLAQAELNQLTARNNVSLARETLRNALGLTGPLDFDVVDNFDVHAAQINETDALAAAYDKRPELQSFRAQEFAANEQIAALQTNYLPNISGNGNYMWSGSEYPLQSNWDIGANVNLSIFSGGLTTAQIGEQKFNLANIRFNEEVERQGIALEVRQATLNLQQAQESIRVAAKAQESARENLELAEGRYNTGVGSIIELTDAQTSRTSAEASYVQALYNYKTSLAALEKATAQDLGSE